ncbi:uncharacterized protein LOC119078545 isoform X5 [Bradysia coprophila]|uniref:uncharacterized protein LOC119078545 isoform X5 n=1 Tax=Bradysia coprophila TaxID=38358 RepID=UPI00187DC4F6|nr:uncharacterized protein LOC119078545 isoform X5 [Bradysia coprophila]
MEVAEANGVQKSSTSMSENSSEVSVEKTASGTIESAKSVQKSVEQSVQQSVQKSEQSTRVVQQSVTSSSSQSEKTANEEEQVRKPDQTDKAESQSSQQQDAAPGKPVDLQKILTPAEDAEEIVPQKNRKLYASSAFFTPGLHPTVEDQVELARRISSSLCDSSNQQSKGQSMYVNRMKRSVKWVHEGEGEADNQQYNGYGADNSKENHEFQQRDKLPLKLVMDPRGQVQDITTLQNCGVSIDSGMLSPDRCAELVTALYAPQGKGAELFAKRRKRSEKWIVDETNAATVSPSGAPGGYSPIPAYTDFGVQRVQQNMKLDQIQAKYSEPRVKLVKSPWEAALQTGFANTAFEEPQSYQQDRGYSAPPPQQQQQSQQPQHPDPYGTPPYQPYSQPSRPAQPKSSSNSMRDLAYKPSIPQGWNAPPPNLPSESPSFEDTIIQKSHSTLDHTVENASCFVQSLSNYNSLNHALSLYVDVHSDQLSNSTINSEYMAQQQLKQIDDSVQYNKEIRQIDVKSSSTENNNTNGYFINKEVIATKELSSNRSAVETVQLRHVQTNAPNGGCRTTNGNRSNDCSNKENEENYENEEYTKVPVKDLICTFEKQTRPVIRYKLREDKLPEPSKMTIGLSVDEMKQSVTHSTSEEHKITLSQNEQFEQTDSYSYSQNGTEFYDEFESSKNENFINGNDETVNANIDKQQDVYTPPEIPLHVYGAPPTNNYLPAVKQPQYNASSYQAPPPSSVYSPYQQQAVSPPSSAYYKPNPINYSPPNQGINQNQPSTTFNPSPIANDKLAIFEQSQQYQSSQHQSRQQTRRPLTVPNTIVRNQSPLPYGSSPVSKPNYGQQQKYPSQAPPQGQPITLYNNTSKNTYQSSQDNYSYQSSPVSNPRSQINLDQVENYNRAARGWGQTRDYYRPITFSKPKVALPYSDF